jgi:hypothetical protein
MKSTGSKGRIITDCPVDWPDGTHLRVFRVFSEDAGLSAEILAAEAEWDDSPEGIEKWCRAVGALEPVVFTDEERAERDRAMAEWKAFIIEATRKQWLAEDKAS